MTVYVQKPQAHVNLVSEFLPGNLQDISLDVTVTAPKGHGGSWLLVVQCPASLGHPARGSIPFWSESPVGRQWAGGVLASVHSKSRWHGMFSCYTGLSEQGQTASTVIKDRDINLSLPALEQNPDSQSAQLDAPVYVENGTKKQGIENVVEVQGQPGSPCPAPSPSESPSGVPVSSATQSASASAAPSGAATSTSSGPPSSTVSAAPSSDTESCYTRVSPSAAFNKYYFPMEDAITTSETLKNVNLSDDRIDSMYPTGQIATNTITWPGGSELSPSLSATNLASAERQNEDAFWAGLMYGIGAALALAFLQGFPEAWKTAKAAEAAEAAEAAKEETKAPAGEDTVP